MKPNRAKKAEVTATLAALNRRLVKMRTGSIGEGTRSSQPTKAARAIAATANPTIVEPLVHPHSGASMIVNTRAPIAPIDRSTPPTSSRGAVASRDSGTRTTDAVTARITIGMLM